MEVIENGINTKSRMNSIFNNETDVVVKHSKSKSELAGILLDFLKPQRRVNLLSSIQWHLIFSVKLTSYQFP